MDKADGAGGGTQFSGAIPDLYERLLVPMMFQDAARSLAAAVAGIDPRDIVETAAGTGVLTRAMSEVCPDARIVATDLSQAMLDKGAELGPQSPLVSRQQADALNLPCADGEFDVVACQFGVMFFPDRVHGYREAARVLRADGAFLFNVWDQLEHNEAVHVIETALNDSVSDHQFTFLRRLPYGYFSRGQIEDDLERAGLTAVKMTEVDAVSRTSAADAAVAVCQGTPLRSEIEDHPSMTIERATDCAEQALVDRFGPDPFEAPIKFVEVMARPVR